MGGRSGTIRAGSPGVFRRGAIVALLTAGATGCVSVVSEGADVSGAYSFETRQNGRREAEGVLTLERSMEGGWDVYLVHGRFGVMEILEAEVDPPYVSVVADGPDDTFRIRARVSGRLMEGRWRHGGREGAFVGRRR